MTKIVKKHDTPKTLDSMVAKIKTEVQAFAANLAGIGKNTTKLAPLVAAAFARYKEEDKSATKLAFMRFFATKEQLAAWPEDDLTAKAPGSATQALFNGVEYLLRRAVTMERIVALEANRAQVLAAAEAKAKAQIKEMGLKGEDAENLIQSYRTEALGSTARKTVTKDEIAQIIYDGWNSELDDFEVFKTFVQQILALKYAEETAKTILEKAETKIAEAQEKGGLVEEAAIPVQLEVQAATIPARATIPFSRHRAA